MSAEAPGWGGYCAEVYWGGKRVCRSTARMSERKRLVDKRGTEVMELRS